MTTETVMPASEAKLRAELWGARQEIKRLELRNRSLGVRNQALERDLEAAERDRQRASDDADNAWRMVDELRATFGLPAAEGGG